MSNFFDLKKNVDKEKEAEEMTSSNKATVRLTAPVNAFVTAGM